MLVTTTFLINSAFNFALGLLIARFLGPQGFGQYAIAASVAVVLNTLFLDWIRLAATRFYSERARSDEPAVRGTLDAIFILSSLGVAITSALAITLGFDFGLMVLLAALAPVMGICNGLFDYHTALVRARFDERSYSLLVIVKNVLSLVLMVGGAWWFQSPIVVAAGFVLSIFATLLIGRRRLIDPDVNILKPNWTAARGYMFYGVPVILASMIYFLIPLWNRTAIASSLGFAASGQFSLAYDLAIRLVQTVGSALDIILFQIALKAEADHGRDRAQEQLSINMGLVLAAVLAVATGYWLVLPSFEALLVPEAFRGAFAAATTILLPGLVCFALVQAAVTPVFQLKQQTWPVVLAALAGLLTNAILSWKLTATDIQTYAAIQAVSYAVAFGVAVVLSIRIMKVLPRLRDITAAVVATLSMAAAVWPLRGWGPGWATLLVSSAVGATVFAAVVVAFNLGGCRGMIRQRLQA
jgi:O-antigen/teichoic acid export membrane protein